MEFLAQLWLPIFVSAVLVWIASFLTHMVLPHHKSEWSGLPNEDEVVAAIKPLSPGLYMFPFGKMEEMKTPEYQAKMKNGPNGTLVIWNGPVNMGKNLGMTFLFYLLVGVFVAYLGHHAILPTDDYLERFRLTGTTAFAAHGLGWMSFFIWFGGGRFWPNFLDAVIYALVTAGTFAWLWPVAAA